MKRMIVMVTLLATACGGAELDIIGEVSEAPQVVESNEVEAPAMAAEEPTPTSIDAPDEEGVDTLSFQALSGHSTELEEAEFLRLINDERRAAGLAPLKVYWDLVDDARKHSKLMDRQSNLHHNPNLTDVTVEGYWARLGENVGVGHGVPSLHRAFMHSSGHRANIMGDFTHVGVGVHHENSLWVTVVFMKAAVPNLHNTYGPFTDDDFSIHERSIHKIWTAGLTYGCGGRSYCPNRSLTRGEMAAFLTRALELPHTSADYFGDDNGTWYERSANAMYESGVTVGCGEARYCGDRDVTRGEMAVFLTRAFELPSSNTDYFNDDEGRFYEGSANAIRQAGYTQGCGGGQYCGERSLTRAEMATFLARALGL